MKYSIVESVNEYWLDKIEDKVTGSRCLAESTDQWHHNFNNLLPITESNCFDDISNN